MSKKAIIFDWGRTLHDPDTNKLFPGVEELIANLAERYTLAVVSLASKVPAEERRRVIESSGIAHHFERILVGAKDKKEMYAQVFSELGLNPQDTVVVDDRTMRGILWGNSQGLTTIWFRNGKFADELPNEETGEPTHTVTEITKLKDLLL